MKSMDKDTRFTHIEKGRLIKGVLEERERKEKEYLVTWLVLINYYN